MAASTVKKSHPIRGALYGIILGLGLALMAIGRKIANLDSITPIILVLVGIVIGIIWGMVAPAKKPKGPAPVETLEPAPAAAEEVVEAAEEVAPHQDESNSGDAEGEAGG